MIRKDSANLGRWEYLIQALILVAVIVLAVNTMTGLSPLTYQILWWTERSFLVVFTIEYIVRIIRAKEWKRYVFSFMGMVDLISILPFWIGILCGSPFIRAFQIFRILRVLKLARYNEAVHLYREALKLSRHELALFGISAGILLFIAGSGIYYFENPAQPKVFSSIPAGLWCAIITLTTVGYGDSVPITDGGRLFTSVILVIGLGIVTIPTAILSSALSTLRKQRHANPHDSSAGPKPNEKDLRD
ncbi:MAG: ion transporter [Puniceicoccales bacterium]